MSIVPNEINLRQTASGLENTSGVTTGSGFEDPTGVHPTAEYFNSTTVNYAAVGSKRNNLVLFSSAENVDTTYPGNTVPSQYPLNQIRETESGHIIEIDDTPGNQRILIKHNNGGGIELKPDGSIIISAKDQKIEVVGGDSKIVVGGDADIVYKGNVNMRVEGDYNLDVRGDANTTISGNKNQTIDGSDRKNVNGNVGYVIRGGYSTTVTQQVTDTFLAGHSHNVKGTFSNNIDGSANYVSSGEATFTSEVRINMSTEDLNIAGTSTSVFGATGTFGGAGVVFYGKGGTFSEGVTAPTFHGDLDGVAETSRVTRSQTYGEASTGSPGAAITNTATPTTALPNGSNITDYLGKAAGGIRKVKIDVGNYIKNLIDKTTATGGVSSTSINTSRARSRLRDPANRSNQQLVGELLANQSILDTYNNPTPRGVGRVVKGGTSPELGEVPIGNRSTVDDVFVPTDVKITLVPEYQYNPFYAGEITSKTKLAPGITMAKFLASDDPTNLNFIKDNTTRIQIAKYYYLHAQILKFVQNDVNKFRDFTLTVAEGLYRPGPDEKITPNSINDLKLKGKAVVYNLLDRLGKSSPTSIFELAAYLKSKVYYDKMILSYDTIDNNLNARLIFIMPNVNDNWEGVYSRTIETELNGTKLTQGELIEVLPNTSVGSFQPQTQFPSGQITQWYSWKDGVDRRVSPVLLDKVTTIAQLFGTPLVITEGYRPPNAGYGANNSQHTKGLAVDIRTSFFSQNDVLRLVRIASENGIVGIGVYQNSPIVHFDIRAGAKLAWGDSPYTYRTIPSWAKYTLDQHMFT